jgi:methyltransferase (TIGR00027 family)
MKKAVIARRLGALLSHVTFVPTDFSTEDLDAVMSRAGYRRDAVTFFICEGVTHYLPAHAVDEIFRYVARHAAVGSRIVFTYLHQGLLDGSVTFTGAATTLATVRRAGEPYTFGLDPARLASYLAALDLTLIEDVGPSAYRERYLRPLGRGREELAEFQRAALAEVTG